MQNSDKIRSYLGFAARANKIVFGTERILMKKSVPVIVLGADAMQNTAKRIKNYAERSNSPVVTLENGTIEEIFKKQNCQVVAVTDVSLANAIIENAK